VVNLADLYRATGREPQAEELLRGGLTAHPGNPALVRALALSLVRQGRKAEALRVLGPIAAASPEAAYLYALALDDAGRSAEAVRVLERALPGSRGNRDILLQLAALHARAGDDAKAAGYLKRLAAINPRDPALGAAAAGALQGR
jgi:Flp pilus assembly protein TadD